MDLLYHGLFVCQIVYAERLHPSGFDSSFLFYGKPQSEVTCLS
jgi:hypothetical protein